MRGVRFPYVTVSVAGIPRDSPAVLTHIEGLIKGATTPTGRPSPALHPAPPFPASPTRPEIPALRRDDDPARRNDGKTRRDDRWSGRDKA